MPLEMRYSPTSELDPMPVCQNGQRARHFSLSLLQIPAEGIGKDTRQLFEHLTRNPPQHSQHRTPEEKVIEVMNLFVLDQEGNLAARIIRHGSEDKIRAAVHKRGNRLSTAAVTLKQYHQLFFGYAGPRREAFDLALEVIFSMWITAPAADGQCICILFARHAKMGKYLIGHLFREGAERGPFATDEGVNGKGEIRPITAEDFDAVIARDLAGRRRATAALWRAAARHEPGGTYDVLF